MKKNFSHVANHLQIHFELSQRKSIPNRNFKMSEGHNPVMTKRTGKNGASVKRKANTLNEQVLLPPRPSYFSQVRAKIFLLRQRPLYFSHVCAQNISITSAPIIIL